MKKIISKFICFVVAAITAFTVFACQKKDDGETSGAQKPREVITTLAENGKSDYRVLLSSTADIVEKTAADELVKYIEFTTGATLPIVTDDAVSASVNGKFISVGENQLFEKVKIDNTNLNREGYVLKTVGKFPVHRRASSQSDAVRRVRVFGIRDGL